MPTIANPTLLVIGVGLVFAGWMLRRWSSRHSLTDQLTEATWDAVKSRDASVIGREIQNKLGEINKAEGAFGKARTAAGFGVRHLVAQVVAIVGLVALLGGLVLAGLGIYWR